MSRSKSMKVGTTAQNATAEATADRAAVEGLSFPRKLRVTNQMPIPIVFPELGLYLIGNTRVPKQGEKNSDDVKFTSEAQLKRLEADAEVLANIHKFDPAVLIEEIEAPAATTAPAPKPAQPMQQTEAPAANSAPVPAATETPAGV
ncbi:hypothetical protein QYH69_33970 [Paraburkholderia sp. SARCC-3016]|uniref:hypothetical protein n=1 Tax=Paraburkholderia sp. SARCC-3016 TaxID=3058611 RepID=UPI00280829D1|nr:hypothetical protein [Paraburkholderia sp. SARCC-3016]MDQ7982233.1 hypothetical protein [Paraburkholderia sp. SARCC-3016]